MSTQKEQLLDKIRQHLQAKYIQNPPILELLEQELTELSSKAKISKSDIDVIEAKLQREANASRGPRHSTSTDAPSRRRGYEEGEDVRRTNPFQTHHQRYKSNIENDATPKSNTKGFKVLQGRLLHTPGLCDNSLYYMSPIDLKILKRNGVIADENNILAKKRINATFIDEGPSLDSPKDRTSKSFMEQDVMNMSYDSETVKRRTTLKPLQNCLGGLTTKMEEREKLIKEDVWHKIEDQRVKQLEEKEKQKQVENKKLTEKWLDDLHKQIDDNKKRREENKMKEFLANAKHVESQTAAHQEYMEKERRYKEYLRAFEKYNNIANMKAKMMHNQIHQFEKKKEAEEAERERVILEKGELDKEKKVIGKEPREQREQRSVSEVRHRKRISGLIGDEKAVQAWVEREEKEAAVRQKYLDFLKERGVTQSSFKKLGKLEVNKPDGKEYATVEVRKNTEEKGLMKFLNEERHTGTEKERMKEKMIHINEIRQEQIIDKNMREIAYRKNLKEQEALWKHQEDMFDMREKLTKEADKLKKLAQKQILDEQIRQARNKKHFLPMTDKEEKLNKAILKQLDTSVN